MQRIETFGQIIKLLEERPDNSTAINYRVEGNWYPVSTREFLYDVKRLAYGLIAHGLKKGDKVGILSIPSPQWIGADLAIMLAGGVSVPLFAKISDDNFIYEVAQADVRFLFVNGVEQWKKFNRHASLFETVIGLNGVKEPEGVLSYFEILKKGEDLWQKKPNLFNEMIDAIKPNDLASIVYTSGSTGAPKGAELTHLNLTHMINQDAFHWVANEKYLSLLPLAHIFARQILYIMLAWDVSIYFLNELGDFASVAKELQPHNMIVVPRLLEKVYEGMLSQVKRQNWLVKKIGLWAFDLAKRSHLNIFQKFFLLPIANLLVYRTLRKQLGGNWRIILCGGAKFSPELYNFFLRIGLPIYEGYGLTEASTVCVNRPGSVVVGTVGPVLSGISIKIGENDEILVGGPTVMQGYYRSPNATKAALDSEGWLHTGDKGKIDDKGYLTLIGRIKEQFKLSTGEYVVPGRIEHILVYNSPLIDYALVVGEGKGFPAALLFADPEELQRLKTQSGLEKMSDADFLNSESVKKEVKALLEETNKLINKFEKIVSYRFILETPTIESGELTPTLKLKRAVIQEKYKDIIDGIYYEESK